MCYVNAKKENKLYNDEYLIIEWQYQEIKTVNKELVGKFVFDVTTSLGNVNLPPTSNGSIVFLYLEKGASGQLKGRQGATYNYLVYSKEDINEINGIHFKGSVIMADGKKLKTYQGGNNLEFDGSVLKSLANAGIIKENPEYTKLSEGTDEEEGGTVISGTSVQYDSYYVATSPQLIISLESQYSSREKIETSGNAAAQPISPSAVILPRVIYLTKNPDGKLIDYYDIVNLNGAHEQKDPSKITCDPSLNTYGLLYQNGKNTTTVTYTFLGRNQGLSMVSVTYITGNATYIISEIEKRYNMTLTKDDESSKKGDTVYSGTGTIGGRTIAVLLHSTGATVTVIYGIPD